MRKYLSSFENHASHSSQSYQTKVFFPTAFHISHFFLYHVVACPDLLVFVHSASNPRVILSRHQLDHAACLEPWGSLLAL